MFLFIGIANANSNKALELTTEEIKKLNKFAREIPVDQGVGQFFMINLPLNYVESFNPKDWNSRQVNGRHPPPIHKILLEEGFGSVLLQQSNFFHLNSSAETEEERISLITSFVNTLQYRAISKKNKGVNIPLFIVIDFEGPLTNTIKNTLIPPPPALTLAISQNKEFIEETGKIIGYQLANSGINMLLGPVLDIDKTPQGVYNQTLLNRSFSSSADGVVSIAAYYIKGLREAGITVIGKHFPGLGAVEGNSHNKIVSFKRRDKDKVLEQDLKEHIQPYHELKPLLNGIMTSHVRLPFLEKNTKPATFNNLVIKFIRDQPFSIKSSLKPLNYNNKLVLTDDLNMKSITQYYQRDYSRMAIQAIEAGHDIIMFAKVITNNDSRHIGIKINELIKVKKDLARYLKKYGKDRYHTSLQRIIQAKAAYYKLHGGNIDYFIRKEKNKIIHSQLFTPALIKGEDGGVDYNKITNIYKKIIGQSYLVLTEEDFGSIDNFSNICIFLPKKYNDSYQELISSHGDKFHLNNMLHSYDGKIPHKEKMKKLEQYINNNACDIIFNIVNNKLSIDNALNISNKLKRKNRNKKNKKIKFVLLVHQNPKFLPKDLIDYKDIVIMGAFTDHYLSYDIDIKIIKGNIKAKHISQLTINYNEEDFPLTIKKPNIKDIIFDYTLFNPVAGDTIDNCSIEKWFKTEKENITVNSPVLKNILKSMGSEKTPIEKIREEIKEEIKQEIKQEIKEESKEEITNISLKDGYIEKGRVSKVDSHAYILLISVIFFFIFANWGERKKHS